MATNLMQLRRLVRSRLGIPLDDDFMTDTVIDDHINLALQAIDAEAHWPWADAAGTATLTVAAPDIVPPSDWRSTRAVMHGDRELALVAPVDLLRRYTHQADIPEVWCPIGSVIAIRPKPNVVFDVIHYYYRQNAWLREDGAEPALPGEYTGAIVAKAAELLAARESSGGDATRHGDEYNKWVARMRRDSRRSTGGVHVRVRAGSWV